MDPCQSIDRTDAELIAAVLDGDTALFELLVRKYQPKVFATARRYAKVECEVEDIVQEVFTKAYRKLGSFRGEAPFEHWLMRMTVRTCYDYLRGHQRNRERAFSELSPEEGAWLVDAVASPGGSNENADAAKALVWRLLEQLQPEARLVLTLMEIEDRSVKEIAALTGWSVPVVKIRAFRARAAMRKCLEQVAWQKYL
jgi:RNA polymerase sigma-70 factor (ECF subfamily)